MTKWEIQNARLSSPWFYFKLKFISTAGETADLITWKQVITKHLREYYGLVGESMVFDVLQLGDDASSIVRCQNEDKNVFSNALLSSVGNLDGYEYTVATVAKSAYLNGVI